MTTLDKLRNVGKALRSVEELLDDGVFSRYFDGKMKAGEAVFSFLSETDDYTIGIATFAKRGDVLPWHKHDRVIQYLIQAVGRTGLSMEGGYRVLEERECARVDESMGHSCVALTDNAVQIFVCVPREQGYSPKR